LTFPKDAFDFNQLSRHLYNALKDSKAKIKYVAMEAFAIMASLIGPDKVLSLLQTQDLDKETSLLLQMRFNDPILPQLSPDGIIQHTIARSNSATPAPQVASSMIRETSKQYLSPRRPSQQASEVEISSLESNTPQVRKQSAVFEDTSKNEIIPSSQQTHFIPKTSSNHEPVIPSADFRRQRSMSETYIDTIDSEPQISQVLQVLQVNEFAQDNPLQSAAKLSDIFKPNLAIRNPVKPHSNHKM
jgi:hypothetical protein